MSKILFITHTLLFGLFSFYSNAQVKKERFNGNFNELSQVNKKLITSFNIKWTDTTFNYKSDTANFQYQLINANNVKEIAKFYDTTIIFIFQPWCEASETQFAEIVKIQKYLTNKTKLLFVADSYYVDHIYDLGDRYNIKNPFYVIDYNYGSSDRINRVKFIQEFTNFGKIKIWINNIMIIDSNSKVIDLTDTNKLKIKLIKS